MFIQFKLRTIDYFQLDKYQTLSPDTMVIPQMETEFYLIYFMERLLAHPIWNAKFLFSSNFSVP